MMGAYVLTRGLRWNNFPFTAAETFVIRVPCAYCGGTPEDAKHASNCSSCGAPAVTREITRDRDFQKEWEERGKQLARERTAMYP